MAWPSYINGLPAAYWDGNRFVLPPWATSPTTPPTAQDQAAQAGAAQVAAPGGTDSPLGHALQLGGQGSSWGNVSGGPPGASYNSRAAAADQGGWQSNLLGGATFGLLGQVPGAGRASTAGGLIGTGVGLATGAPMAGALGSALGSTIGQREAAREIAQALQDLYSGPAAEPAGGWASVGEGLSTAIPAGLAPAAPPTGGYPEADPSGGWYGTIFGQAGALPGSDGGVTGHPGSDYAGANNDAGMGIGAELGAGGGFDIGGWFNRGGTIPQAPRDALPGPDDQIIAAQSGEGVLTRAAMKRYPGLLEAANAGSIPKKAMRGLLKV